jgi:hypothetical protein
MATAEECRVVRDSVRELCDPFRRVVERSWERADRVFVDLEMP